MPSSSTLRQGSYVSSPSSMTSNSVLRSVSPYQQQEQIPDITLQEYGRILDDNDDYVNLMAILYPQSNFYSRTVTMRQLLITAQKIRREADRLEEEGQRIFVEMEGLGLQQVLRPHRTSPSLEPYSRPPTLYYPAPGQEARSPTPPPTSPPLGTPGNPIIIEDDEEELDRRSDNFYTAESTFSTPISFLLHCQECTDQRHQYYKCPQYICDHCYRRAPRHRVSDCPDRYY